MAKEVRPYLPIDLDWLEEFNRAGPLLLGRQGGAVVVRVHADAPEEKPSSFQPGYDYVRELIRLARIGQRLEQEAAAAIARGEGVEVNLR